MQKIRMRLLGFFCAIALGIATGGCDARSDNSSAPSRSGPVQALASVYPMAQVLQQIGQEHVSVQWLAEGAQHPEDLEPDAALKQRAGSAALIITSGPWDAWARAELGPEVRTTRLLEPTQSESATGADLNAYLWLDPLVMRDIVETMRLRLTLLDPAHDQAYRSAATSVTAEIDQVDREFRSGLAKVSGKTVLAVRPAWSAMCTRYGLKPLAPVQSTESKLTQEDFRTLTRAGKEQGAKAIFVDAATPASVRQQIEDRTGLTPVMLDAMGTSAPDGRSTWVKIMRYNLEELKKGLE